MYGNHINLSTNGSKNEEIAVLYIYAEAYICPLPNGVSVFLTESKVLLLVLEHVSKTYNDEFVIFSDSLSAL